MFKRQKGIKPTTARKESTTKPWATYLFRTSDLMNAHTALWNNVKKHIQFDTVGRIKMGNSAFRHWWNAFMPSYGEYTYRELARFMRVQYSNFIPREMDNGDGSKSSVSLAEREQLANEVQHLHRHNDLLTNSKVVPAWLVASLQRFLDKANVLTEVLLENVNSGRMEAIRKDFEDYTPLPSLIVPKNSDKASNEYREFIRKPPMRELILATVLMKLPLSARMSAQAGNIRYNAYGARATVDDRSGISITNYIGEYNAFDHRVQELLKEFSHHATNLYAMKRQLVANTKIAAALKKVPDEKVAESAAKCEAPVRPKATSDMIRTAIANFLPGAESSDLVERIDLIDKIASVLRSVNIHAVPSIEELRLAQCLADHIDENRTYASVSTLHLILPGIYRVMDDIYEEVDASQRATVTTYVKERLEGAMINNVKVVNFVLDQLPKYLFFGTPMPEVMKLLIGLSHGNDGLQDQYDIHLRLLAVQRRIASDHSLMVAYGPRLVEIEFELNQSRQSTDGHITSEEKVFKLIHNLFDEVAIAVYTQCWKDHRVEAPTQTDAEREVSIKFSIIETITRVLSEAHDFPPNPEMTLRIYDILPHYLITGTPTEREIKDIYSLLSIRDNLAAAEIEPSQDPLFIYADADVRLAVIRRYINNHKALGQRYTVHLATIDRLFTQHSVANMGITVGTKNNFASSFAGLQKNPDGEFLLKEINRLFCEIQQWVEKKLFDSLPKPVKAEEIEKLDGWNDENQVFHPLTVATTDISKFFESIDHWKISKVLAKELSKDIIGTSKVIHEETMAGFIRSLLAFEYQSLDGSIKTFEKGLTIESHFQHLMANVYVSSLMNRVVQILYAAYPQMDVEILSYVDDIYIFVRSDHDVQLILDTIKEVFEEDGLKLAEQKTKIYREHMTGVASDIKQLMRMPNVAFSYIDAIDRSDTLTPEEAGDLKEMMFGEESLLHRIVNEVREIKLDGLQITIGEIPFVDRCDREVRVLKGIMDRTELIMRNHDASTVLTSYSARLIKAAMIVAFCENMRNDVQAGTLASLNRIINFSGLFPYSYSNERGYRSPRTADLERQINSHIGKFSRSRSLALLDPKLNKTYFDALMKIEDYTYFSTRYPDEFNWSDDQDEFYLDVIEKKNDAKVLEALQYFYYVKMEGNLSRFPAQLALLDRLCRAVMTNYPSKIRFLAAIVGTFAFKKAMEGRTGSYSTYQMKKDFNVAMNRHVELLVAGLFEREVITDLDTLRIEFIDGKTEEELAQNAPLFYLMYRISRFHKEI